MKINLKKRHLIQTLAAMITNANAKGFFEGTIYKGSTKTVCVPGLNCYSCPGAVGACPIGSLQAVAGGGKYKISYFWIPLVIRGYIWQTDMRIFMSIWIYTGFIA